MFLMTILDIQKDVENEKGIKNMIPVYPLLSLRKKTWLFFPPDYIAFAFPRGNFAPANLNSSFLEWCCTTWPMVE